MPTTTPSAGRRVRWDRWLLALYVASVVVIAIQKGFFTPDNNFAIFRAAFGNLAAGRDMYVPHPDQYLDLYKYSPTFAVLFAPIAILPLPLGILAWSAANALLLYYAVRRLLPDEEGNRQATLALALMYFDVLRATQRAQSNSLVTALVILAFIALERRRQVAAALSLGVGALVKIFPLAAVPLAIFYPRRVRFAAIFAAVMVGLIALPLLVVPPHELLAQYASWRRLEAVDAVVRAGTTGAGVYGGVMAQIRMWFGVDWPNWPIQLAGTVIILLPIVVRWRDWDDYGVRLRMLCSMLVYMVIFNQRSESPTFVIAVTGIAIWYVTSPRTWLHTALMALTVIVVSLSSTEITPHSIQKAFFVKYHLKTVPCALAWLVMQVELLGLWPRGVARRAVERPVEVGAGEA